MQANRERLQHDAILTRLQKAEQEVENLTATLLDTLNQPTPPVPPPSQISQNQVNSLVKATATLVDKHAALKTQRERFILVSNSK
jgi:hypothetical protein